MASSSSSSPDPAGFGARAAALLVDALIVFTLVAPAFVLGVRMRLVPLEAAGPLNLAGSIALAAAVIGFWRVCGATPGKIALGLQIVDAEGGGRPGLGRLALRFLGYFVSAFPLYIGFLWAAFDRRGQAWHDKIARTLVINAED